MKWTSGRLSVELPLAYPDSASLSEESEYWRPMFDLCAVQTMHWRSSEGIMEAWRVFSTR